MLLFGSFGTRSWWPIHCCGYPDGSLTGVNTVLNFDVLPGNTKQLQKRHENKRSTPHVCRTFGFRCSHDLPADGSLVQDENPNRECLRLQFHPCIVRVRSGSTDRSDIVLDKFRLTESLGCSATSHVIRNGESLYGGTTTTATKVTR